MPKAERAGLHESFGALLESQADPGQLVEILLGVRPHRAARQRLARAAVSQSRAARSSKVGEGSRFGRRLWRRLAAMKYVLMFSARQDDPSPSPEVYGRIMEWFQTNGSKIVGGEELQGTSMATTVRFKNGKPVVMDGPFIETKEVISGYAEVEVADLDEAIALAKAWPGQGAVEIRPTVDHSPS